MNRFSKLKQIGTYLNLGISNLITVAFYRLAIKSGYFAKSLPTNTLCSKEHRLTFFNVVDIAPNNTLIIPQLKGFGWISLSTTKPPNWLQAINSTKLVKNNSAHWSQFDDFSLDIGDIKTLWENSRLDWLVNFSLHYLQSGNPTHIEKINTWLHDWCMHNPVNQGVNWKCGQEASIRVLHLATALHLLQQTVSPTTHLSTLLFEHLKRIAPTLRYAMAQDNNHGTSEAAALYIGSLILSKSNKYQQHNLVKKWQKQGRYWLENRVNKLIDADGTFSQNSVNYHRLMLDCLSLVEFFRLEFSCPSFSERFYKQAKKASYWLWEFTEPTTGNAPNMGANDGANLLPLTQADYCDFRPSVQWACMLFHGCYPYTPQGNYQQLSTLMQPKITQDIEQRPPISSERLATGFHIIANENAKVFLRTPNAKFRPNSCDALHVDLWLGPTNLLRDAGSYSYNCQAKWQDYFVSTQAHNTVQFDNNEQMSKVSRFLYSNWIKSTVESVSKNSITAKYSDANHCSHQRSLELNKQQLTVIDDIANFSDLAVLRWRLAPMAWLLNGNTLSYGKIKITINSNVNIEHIALVDGYESRYYLHKNTIPVLEITIKKPGKITTLIEWQL